jgi:sugar lactone lactonase YvrE
VRWDERRQRLYFVDALGQTLHWMDGAQPPLHAMRLDGTPTGVVLTEGPELVVCLDDGLFAVDPDAGTTSRVSPYPPELGGRANDAHADGFGGLVTGTLNLVPGPARSGGSR